MDIFALNSWAKIFFYKKPNKKSPFYIVGKLKKRTTKGTQITLSKKYRIKLHMNKNLYFELKVCKPLFERLYGINFYVPEIKRNNTIDIEKFVDLIGKAYENLGFYHFYYDGIKERLYINFRHNEIEREQIDKDFPKIFLKRLIYNSAVSAYISLKYKKGKDDIVIVADSNKYS